MQEYEIVESFIRYLKDNRIKFLREVNLGGVKIDFLVHEKKRWVGVEVKGDRSDPINTLGQLVNYYQYLSHLYLCASPDFIRKIMELMISNPEISHLTGKIGLISVKDGKIRIAKVPSNSRYYLSIKRKKLRKREGQRFPKYGILDEVDKKILELARKNKPLLLGEIQKQTGLSYGAVRKRIKNLAHFGYIKILSKYPTCIGVVDEKGKANEKV